MLFFFLLLLYYYYCLGGAVGAGWSYYSPIITVEVNGESNTQGFTTLHIQSLGQISWFKDTLFSLHMLPSCQKEVSYDNVLLRKHVLKLVVTLHGPHSNRCILMFAYNKMITAACHISLLLEKCSYNKHIFLLKLPSYVATCWGFHLQIHLWFFSQSFRDILILWINSFC